MSTINALNNQATALKACALGVMISLLPLAADARRDADNDRDGGRYDRQTERGQHRGSAPHRQFLPGEQRQGKPHVEKAPRPSQEQRRVERQQRAPGYGVSSENRQRQDHQQGQNRPRPVKQEQTTRRAERDEDQDNNRGQDRVPSRDKHNSPRFLPGEQHKGKPPVEKYRSEGSRDERREAPRTETRRHDAGRDAGRESRQHNGRRDHRNNSHRVHSSHDRHYRRYVVRRQHDHHYHRHETYRYHTRYLAPIRHHYHPIGFRLTVLPHSYIRIVVGGLPYFYFGGVFYHHHNHGYVVVRAPLGAVVAELPIGFIAFSIGAFTYYHVNDTYYIWDDAREAYVVVDKPRGADTALAKATQGRLVVYPNEGQSEELQAKDRYSCHRWAVTESRVDPTLEDSADLTREERDHYRRAISACLEGRGYTVK